MVVVVFLERTLSDGGSELMVFSPCSELAVKATSSYNFPFYNGIYSFFVISVSISSSGKLKHKSLGQTLDMCCYNISYVSVCALLKVWTLDSEW